MPLDPNFRGVGAAIAYHGFTLRRLRGYGWQVCPGDPDEYRPSFGFGHTFKAAQDIADSPNSRKFLTAAEYAKPGALRPLPTSLEGQTE